MVIDFYKEAQALFDYTVTLRRDFHKHPELGFQEFRTAGIVAEELNKLDIEVTTGVAETGVVGIIEGGKPGPVVLLRFDMDALPILEETGAEYTSSNEGVMHACGHDGHTAVGLTVAKMLHKHRADLAGTVKLVFQPAEEVIGGAERMVAAGVLQDPKPDYTLAMHLWNTMDLGIIGVTPGPAMAGALSMLIRVHGVGAHGAHPDLGVDPIAASAQIISAAQSIVSRNVSPLDTAVMSITAINGGTAYNVIPPTVEMKGTIRYYREEVRVLAVRRLEEIVQGVATAMGCTAEIIYQDSCPAVVNDVELSTRVQGLVNKVLPDADLRTEERTMGAEDMSFMMADIPGVYMFVGSKNEAKDLKYGHHHPKFDFDEQAMAQGAALVAAAAADFLVAE
jgi:amidohydrolase